jgi:competence protein ComEC
MLSFPQEKKSVFSFFLLFSFTLFVLLFVFLFFSQEKKSVLRIVFFNVGQGDSIFIESPTGTQMLIDGGKGSGITRFLGKEMGFWDREIDIVLATHMDLDHIGGLPDVLSLYSVKTVFLSKNKGKSKDADFFLSLIEDKNIPVYFPSQGEILSLGGGVFATFLFPSKESGFFEDPNSASIILLLSYGEHTFLFTGDAPLSIEEYIAKKYGEKIRAHILKAGHHGSHTSTSEYFLTFVDPLYAIISAGCNNPYGHPHPAVLERLKKREIEILETCKEGHIIFESDGKVLKRK